MNDQETLRIESYGLLHMGILEDQSLDSLKNSLQREWDKIPQDFLRATVDAVPTRLKACIAANGNRFEIDY